MKNRVVVFYHFYERDQSYIDNLAHFCIFGVINDVDYCFIISGDTKVSIPEAENIKVIRTENKNNDFGGYCLALSDFPIDSYDHFIFINSSMRGPFLTGFSREKWVDFFLDQFTDSDVGLVGATINLLHQSSPYTKKYRDIFGTIHSGNHVQTGVYCISQKAILALKNSGFYDVQEKLTKDDVIVVYEIRMSQFLINAGFSLRCLLPEYNVLNLKNNQIDVNLTSDNGDPCYPNSYFGRTMHPYEVIFIKANRNLYSIDYLNRLAFRMLHTVKIETSNIFTPEVDSYLFRLSQISGSTIKINEADKNLDPLETLNHCIRFAKNSEFFRKTIEIELKKIYMNS